MIANLINKDELIQIFNEHKDKIIINNSIPEIKRELALKLLQLIVKQLNEKNYIVSEDINFIKLDTNKTNYIIAKYEFNIINLDNPNVKIKFVEVGESEIYNEYSARIATTRAIKRLIEKLVGDEIINNLLSEFYEDIDMFKKENIESFSNIEKNPFSTNIATISQPKYITDKQKELIMKMATEARILSQVIDYIQKKFNKNDIDELTINEASKIIEMLKAVKK